MMQIFISHSQYDRAIRDFFVRAITNSGLKPILMEYQNLSHQNAGKVIKQNIIRKDCKCLIVLIGERILFSEGYNYSFTHNWVGYEVGIAACYNKPIIMFEQDSMNFNDIVQFPIPYLDHYVRYNQDETNSRYIRRLLKDNIPSPKNMVPIKAIRCPYEHCRAEYIYWNIERVSKEESMYCPACRYPFRPFIDINLKKPDRSGRMPSNVV